MCLFQILLNQNFNFGLDWIRFAGQMNNKILKKVNILNLLKMFQVLQLFEVNINFRVKLFLKQCHDEPYLTLLNQFFFIYWDHQECSWLLIFMCPIICLYIKQSLPFPWVILYTRRLPTHNLTFKCHGLIITFNVIVYSRLDTSHRHIPNLVITSMSFYSKITY